MKNYLSLLACVAALNATNDVNGANGSSQLGYSYQTSPITYSQPHDVSSIDELKTIYIHEERNPRSKSEAIRVALSQINDSFSFDIPFVDTFTKFDNVYSEPFSFTEKYSRNTSDSNNKGFTYDTDVSLKKVGLTVESGNGFFSGLFTEIDLELKASVQPEYEFNFRRRLTDNFGFRVSVDEDDTRASIEYRSDTIDFKAMSSQLGVGLVKLVTFQK